MTLVRSPPVPHARDELHAPEIVWTVVVAGGRGARYGSLKQFEQLGGRSLVEWSASTAAEVSAGVVVVLPATELDRWPGAVSGGSTRSESVRHGLAEVPADATIVCVHDAVRPFATTRTYDAVIAAVRAGADGAVPGTAVTDTIKRVDTSGRVVDTPPRDALAAVQTPQAFRAAMLRRAHAGGAVGTDDAELVEAIGGTIKVVNGDPANIKVTHPGDLERATSAAAVAAPRPAAVRIGNGLDVHRFSDDADRPLVLGGCEFPGERGLVGHSDADAVAHAVADALLGAAGLGDIGQQFPDTDERWRGADSIALLRRVADLLDAEGWTATNVDCNVMCETPKLAPRRAEMEQHLSQAIGAPVSVKGRRAEGLGAIGRREGIACWAVAMIERKVG
jgi:2-C-methyl-D-erythritol 4-phosphate cytidylyltransferase/2-C-methyl-D-erythritol 2,4-cyclodiphosphate synthase